MIKNNLFIFHSDEVIIIRLHNEYMKDMCELRINDEMNEMILAV